MIHFVDNDNIGCSVKLSKSFFSVFTKMNLCTGINMHKQPTKVLHWLEPDLAQSWSVVEHIQASYHCAQCLAHHPGVLEQSVLRD